jgi:ribosomal-protein-alanine N-acetyltransferase
MTAPSDHLMTERLLLRKPVPVDAALIAREYGHDPDVTRYLLFRHDQPDSAIEEFVGQCIGAWDKETAFAWVIERRDNGELAGMIDARVDSYMVNVGYVLARKQWGKGFAAEALREIVRWSDEQSDIHRLWAVCAVENHASARVLEKAGLQRESYLPGHLVFPNLGPVPHDCLCYSRLKNGPNQ